MTTPTASKQSRVSHKASLFTESVIREMTREALKYGAVNLSQGFPDFAAPDDIKRKAMQAIERDVNQYAITWGAKDFRDAITQKTKWYLGLDIDPETEITVTCGSTEGMIAAMMATVDPGDEVIVFEPFYENYAPDEGPGMEFRPAGVARSLQRKDKSNHYLQSQQPHRQGFPPR